MKTDRHRIALACVAGGMLPLEMLSTCTCYSRFHWRWFGYVWPSYCTRGHLWFLHVLGSYWTTCQDLVVPHVSFLLAHVSCCDWVTCHFFIGPSVVFLLVHVAWPQYPTCLSFTRPRVSMLYVRVSVFYWATCRALSYPCFFFWFGHVVGWIYTTYFICIGPHGLSWLLHISFTGSSTCQILT